MKRLMPLLIALVVVGATASILWAQEGTQPPRERPPRGPGMGMMQPAPDFTGLDLSEEQQKKVKDLAQEREKALKAWQEANAEKIKAAQAAVDKARTDNDREAMTKAREEMRTLYQGQRDIAQKLDAQLLAVLTPEQKAKYFEKQAMTMVGRRFAPAKLTEEQMAKVKAAYAEATKDVKLDDEKARGEAMQKLVDQIEKTILTDEQREAMTKAAATRPAGPRGPRPGAGG